MSVKDIPNNKLDRALWSISIEVLRYLIVVDIVTTLNCVVNIGVIIDVKSRYQVFLC